MPGGLKCFAGSLVGVLTLLVGIDSSHAAPCAAGLLTGSAAMNSDWRNDTPGLCRQILPADLPPPSASHISRPRTVARPHSMRVRLPSVPAGFHARLFHQGGAQPRLIRTAPNGDIFVADSRAGRIRVLRPGGSCTSSASAVFAEGLNLPFGIAFYPPGPTPQYVYIAENSRIVRFPYINGMLTATAAALLTFPVLVLALGGLQRWAETAVRMWN